MHEDDIDVLRRPPNAVGKMEAQLGYVKLPTERLMNIDASKFPSLALMQGVQEESQSIGAFIEWIGENGMAV